MSSLTAADCRGTTLYAVLDDQAMQSGAMGVFAPLFQLLAAPFRGTVVKQLQSVGA